MRQMRWASGAVVTALALACSGVSPAAGEVASDRPAAVVVFPDILVFNDNETVIQLSNTSADPAIAHCFYENANSHCSNTGQVCLGATDCCSGAGCGLCLPEWDEVDFKVYLTPRQPLGWRVRDGLVDFPLDGVNRRGIRGSSNAGSRIPPVPELPFDGALKCISINDRGEPVDRNVLKGEATTYNFRLDESDTTDVSKYNAIGILAIPGAVNSDDELVIGGDEPEYEGCPNILTLNHFFDFVESPLDGATIQTELIMVPCTQDLLRQIPGTAVVQYLVYNEFEQRFSTSKSLNCKQKVFLSDIDTTQPSRSIFSAGVGGTLTGHTRLTPIGSGAIAVAREYHTLQSHPMANSIHTADFNVHFTGDRSAPDLITLP